MKVRPFSMLAVRGVTGGALCLSACVVLTACSGGTARDADARTQVPHWKPGVTAADVGDQMHVRIPAEATDRHAAYQNGFQDDGLLLAFTVPTARVGAFLSGLAPEQELTHRAKPLAQTVKPTTPFAHLGLKEPETLADVRSGPVCAPCAGELNSLEVAVHPVDAQHSRVYLRGVD
ncbi:MULTISPECIES: hypothetical protein [unclassified Streptomyces]|uniref:hypothetical protein n=1 Tax=unclassified Streptomyces TaxID=2593676 RepID=UPI00131E43CE|nr:hypothetical protein [Streptomyces sp. CB01635]